MTNSYYNSTGAPANNARGSSAAQRNQFSGIEDGFDLLPEPGAVSGGLIYTCTTGGVANTYTATVDAKVTSYINSLTLALKISASNTGASTVNVNSLGAKSIKTADGDDVAAADLTANKIVLIQYNTTDGYFTLIGGATLTSASTAQIDAAVEASLKPLDLFRATVASHATTADIWGALGNQIDFTGTATVTAFPAAPQAGASRTLVCAAPCSFTAGANLLIAGVSSGNTVTCAANDKIVVEAITTTQFLLTRIRYDGTPQVAGLRLITVAEVTANVATIDFTGIDSTYDEYEFHLERLVPASGATLQMLYSVDGGANWLAANYKFMATYVSSQSAATVNATGSNGTTVIGLTPNSVSTAAFNSYGASGVVRLFAPSKTGFKSFIANITHDGGGVAYLNKVEVAGVCTDSTSPVNAIRFQFSSGDIDSGFIRMYGVRKS
jgi:hypothetical protein